MQLGRCARRVTLIASLLAIGSAMGCATAATDDEYDDYTSPILSDATLPDALVEAAVFTPLDADVPTLDAALPDATVMDAGRDASADASRADASLPDASKPDASKPDASQPDASLADASQPDANTGGMCKVDSCPACPNGNERCCANSTTCGCKYIFNSICY